MPWWTGWDRLLDSDTEDNGSSPQHRERDNNAAHGATDPQNVRAIQAPAGELDVYDDAVGLFHTDSEDSGDRPRSGDGDEHATHKARDPRGAPNPSRAPVGEPGSNTDSLGVSVGDETGTRFSHWSRCTGMIEATDV